MTKEQHYKNFAEALLKVSKVRPIIFSKHCSETVINLEDGRHIHLDSWRTEIERIDQATNWFNSLIDEAEA